MDNIVAYIGLDWGDEWHSVHLQTPEGAIEHVALEQTPAVLHDWVAQLRQRFAGGRIAVALEQRKGAVIHALLQYDCFVLYPINPKALARYRQAFHTSGAKDDPLDSALLLNLVVRHRDQLRAWVPDTVESRTLEALCEQRRKLVNQRVALTNRLTSLLKQYFPQALDWVGDVASEQACDFLTQWPTLAVVQRARPTTLQRFYRAHNCRQADVIETRLAAIASARPLTTDAAVVEPLSLAVQAYATQLPALIAAIQTFDVRIPGVCRAGRPRRLRELPRCRCRLCPEIGRGLWHRPVSLGLRRGAADALGHCARHRAQWQDHVGTSPLGLSHLREANLSRIR